ncbi:MAG: hypothetical protein K6G56_03680 [Clostridiales bacterium]|nr:hypothetical protein [Clostridiales bacterium]
MKRFLIAAVIISALWAIIFCGCGKEPGKDPVSPTEETATEAPLVDEKVIELAAAFRLFGGVDAQTGLDLGRLEHFVYCMYTSSLEECELEGYGRVSVETADAMINAVLGVDPKGILRTEYDPTKEQELFCLNSYYYVRRTDGSGFRYEIKSDEEVKNDKGEVQGREVSVNVFEGDELESVLVMKLLPPEEGALYYRVVGCEVRFTK